MKYDVEWEVDTGGGIHDSTYRSLKTTGGGDYVKSASPWTSLCSYVRVNGRIQNVSLHYPGVGCPCVRHKRACKHLVGLRGFASPIRGKAVPRVVNENQMAAKLMMATGYVRLHALLWGTFFVGSFHPYGVMV